MLSAKEEHNAVLLNEVNEEKLCSKVVNPNSGFLSYGYTTFCMYACMDVLICFSERIIEQCKRKALKLIKLSFPRM